MSALFIALRARIPPSTLGANLLSMLEPSTSGFNQPETVFSNHPRGMMLVANFQLPVGELIEIDLGETSGSPNF